MQIQNFRFYLQDATNFFSVLDYIITDQGVLVPVKHSLFNRFYDPIKTNGKRFFVERDSFTIRSVVDKEESEKALIEVFDAVVRYYTFQQFVEFENFGFLKYTAVKNKNQYILKVEIQKREHILAEVNLIKTRSKGIVETVLFDSSVIGLLALVGVSHLDPEELERLGEDEDGDPVPVDDEFQAMLNKSFCFDEYMGEDEPNKRVVVTGRQILELYWPFWKEQMVKQFGENSQLINFKNCIDDYCVVNWAWEWQEGKDINVNKL